jgi:DNA mismatch repair protein MutS2
MYKKHAVIEAIKDKTKLLDDKINEVKSMLNTLKVEATSLPLTSKIKGKLKDISTEKETKNIVFDVGESVYIDSYGQIGIILSKKGNRYDVQIGHFKMTFTKDELSKTKEQPKIQPTKKIQHTAKPSSTYIYELDLRGFRFEDVKPELEKAIDQAVMSNQETLRVIHGFGTGAVRKAVYQFIKGHPNIKSHRFGQEGEGLNGVTVLTLK